jgi:hypothetical protein
VLNVYERREVAIRASREGGIPILYDLFCPKILAGQEQLPRSLPDRCITLSMEKNVKDIPLDVEVPIDLKAQLEYYQARHSTDPNVDKEELKHQIGDNRVTQLFYPLYSVCPTLEGRHALFELAKEIVEERRTDEGTSDLAEVLEAVVVTWISVQDPEKPLTQLTTASIVQNCPFDTMPSDTKNKNAWLGRRLAKLGFKPTRFTVKERGVDGEVVERATTERGVQMRGAKLLRLCYRFLPQYAVEVSKASKVSTAPLPLDGVDALDGSRGK